MRDLKISIAVGVFLAVVLIGAAARSVYYKSRVLDPLTRLALEVPGVESVRVAEWIEGKKDVYVEFEPTARLEESYPEVEALARAAFGRALGRVIPVDRRSEELADAYYDVHFLVQEGISTGRFSEMASLIAERLRGLGVERHRVFVGDRFVYVHLYDGDRYLFEVAPRPAFPGQGAAAQGGAAAW